VKRFFTVALAMVVGVILSLASVLALLEATLHVELIENMQLRMLAELATLILGVLLLVLSVFLYVRLTVTLFGGKPPARSYVFNRKIDL
jgi:hypothetical protein